MGIKEGELQLIQSMLHSSQNIGNVPCLENSFLWNAKLKDYNGLAQLHERNGGFNHLNELGQNEFAHSPSPSLNGERNQDEMVSSGLDIPPGFENFIKGS